MRASAICLSILALSAALVGGCMSAAQHQQALSSTAERNTTLGLVQKEIRIGMSQADVAEALGSPNIVSRDTAGKDTWVYDKIATEVSYSRDSGGMILMGLLLGTYGGAGAGGGYSKQSGAASSTQRSLTVVIRFDSDGLVESTTYHASKF